MRILIPENGTGIPSRHRWEWHVRAQMSCPTCLHITPIKLVQGLLLWGWPYAQLLGSWDVTQLNFIFWRYDLIWFQKLWLFGCQGVGRGYKARVTSSQTRWAGPQRSEPQGSCIPLCLPFLILHSHTVASSSITLVNGWEIIWVEFDKQMSE